jgi:hypothetical protein
MPLDQATDRGAPRGPIPGEREPRPQTRLGGPTTSLRLLTDWPMDAATIADKRREGGGAPRKRRPATAESGWTRTWRAVHRLLVPAPQS